MLALGQERTSRCNASEFLAGLTLCLPAAFRRRGPVAKSALGQKRTSDKVCVMSALPPKADIDKRDGNVRFVPKADIAGCQFCAKSGHRTLARETKRGVILIEAK
jgi:hypothetical protein